MELLVDVEINTYFVVINKLCAR